MRTNGPIQLMPMLRIAACVVVGIVIADGLQPWLITWSWGALLAISIVVAATLRHHPVGQSVGVMVASVFLGGCLMAMKLQGNSVELDNGETTYKAVLLSEPTVRGKVIRCDLRIMTGRLTGQKVKASILRDTVEHRYRQLHIGSSIVARSVMEPPRDFGTSNFSYRRYLACHGFVATTFVYWNHWRESSAGTSGLSFADRVRLKALSMRQRLLEQYVEQGMGGQALAVAMAMTLGDKSMLSAMTRDTYAVSGASHVLALSGLHLGIIYALLTLLTGGGRRRLFTELLMLIAIWSYVAMVGMSASVVRAAVMITVYALVGLLNRSRMSLNTLGLAAIIMLVANPLNVYDVGFELSFISVFSILLLYRPIYGLVNEEWLLRHQVTKWLWSLTVVSVTAQLGAAPLVVYYFGRFSCYFLLTNFIVIPLTTCILYLSVCVLVLAFFPAVCQLAATLLMLVVNAMNLSLAWIASLPGASIGDIYINRVQLWLIYVLLAIIILILSLFLKRRQLGF